MKPDEVDMRIGGVPKVVAYVETTKERVTIVTADGRDYSFNIRSLRKALRASRATPARPMDAGRGEGKSPETTTQEAARGLRIHFKVFISL